MESVKPEIHSWSWKLNETMTEPLKEQKENSFFAASLCLKNYKIQWNCAFEDKLSYRRILRGFSGIEVSRVGLRDQAKVHRRLAQKGIRTGRNYPGAPNTKRKLVESTCWEWARPGMSIVPNAPDWRWREIGTEARGDESSSSSFSVERKRKARKEEQDTEIKFQQ